MKKSFLLFASVSAMIAVALGALGAHYLKGQAEKGILTLENLQSYETAVRYQMYHALAILILALFIKHQADPKLNFAIRLFMIGTVLFSGSIYILSTRALMGMPEGFKWLGPVTPLGGLCFIAGWVMLAIYFWKNNHFNKEPA